MHSTINYAIMNIALNFPENDHFALTAAMTRNPYLGITKIATSDYFEARIEGEECVVSVELIGRIEAFLTALVERPVTLEEHVVPGFEAQTQLSVKLEDAGDILHALMSRVGQP